MTPNPSFRLRAPRRLAAALLLLVATPLALLAVGCGRAHDDGAAPAASASAAAEVWYCPMHPSVTSDRPGECPICHMDLVTREPAAGTAAASAPQPATSKYTCPMHPNVVQDGPGTCPICKMDLVPAETGKAEPAAAGHSVVVLDAARRQLIGLATAPAIRGAIGGEVRATGRVTADETRIHHVHTKYEAWVEELFADFTGKWVRAGEPLARIYSPELLAAQEEFLLALRAQERLAGKESGPTEGSASALVESARRRLILLDVTSAEIDAIARRGTTQRTVTLHSPFSGYVIAKVALHGMKATPMDSLFDIADLSTVWVIADVYESELARVSIGQRARMSLAYRPGREWHGRVTWIEPIVDPATRTVKVRLEFANPKGELKPEMFASVVLSAPEREALTIPEDAVVDGGLTRVVFVDKGDGRIEPREVTIGQRGNGRAEVLSGLAEGEQVATRANFLLDSESRLKAALEAIAAPAAGHDGGHRP